MSRENETKKDDFEDVLKQLYEQVKHFRSMSKDSSNPLVRYASTLANDGMEQLIYSSVVMGRKEDAKKFYAEFSQHLSDDFKRDIRERARDITDIEERARDMIE
jgi:phosphoenolpyruvate-protein kinase (PTS system EI component)